MSFFDEKTRVSEIKLLHFIKIDKEKLKEFLIGTPAEAIFSGSEKAVGSARFVLSKNLAPHLKMPEGNFSLRDWLDDGKPGTLFITWQEEMKRSLNHSSFCQTSTMH